MVENTRRRFSASLRGWRRNGAPGADADDLQDVTRRAIPPVALEQLAHANIV